MTWQQNIPAKLAFVAFVACLIGTAGVVTNERALFIKGVEVHVFEPIRHILHIADVAPASSATPSQSRRHAFTLSERPAQTPIVTASELTIVQQPISVPILPPLVSLPAAKEDFRIQPPIFLPFIGSSIPEPSIWIMLLAGFGIIGYLLRKGAAGSGSQVRVL